MAHATSSTSPTAACSSQRTRRGAYDLVLQRFHLHHVPPGEHVSARANALTPARDKRRELRFGLLGVTPSFKRPRTERK